MLFAELLRAFDDVICCTFAPRIDVAGGEFLSKANRSARLDDVDHIVT